jgi:hypothetical protein
MLPAGRVTTSPCGTITALQSRSKRTGSLVREYMQMKWCRQRGAQGRAL